MNALSLHQPWASFIAIGIKPFETRDWSPPPNWIGQRIAIHAAKKPVNRDDREWAAKHGVADIPLGAIVCTALLIGAYQCSNRVIRPHVIAIARRREMPEIVHIEVEGIPTDEFGDYSPGRWVWHLTDIERLNPPVPALGRQGPWQWSETPNAR